MNKQVSKYKAKVKPTPQEKAPFKSILSSVLVHLTFNYSYRKFKSQFNQCCNFDVCKNRSERTLVGGYPIADTNGRSLASDCYRF